MKIEIRKDRDREHPHTHQLLEIIEVDTQKMSMEEIRAEVGAALIDHGLRNFGPDTSSAEDKSIFGSHVRHRVTNKRIYAY